MASRRTLHYWWGHMLCTFIGAGGGSGLLDSAFLCPLLFLLASVSTALVCVCVCICIDTHRKEKTIERQTLIINPTKTDLTRDTAQVGVQLAGQWAKNRLFDPYVNNIFQGLEWKLNVIEGQGLSSQQRQRYQLVHQPQYETCCVLSERNSCNLSHLVHKQDG